MWEDGGSSEGHLKFRGVTQPEIRAPEIGGVEPGEDSPWNPSENRLETLKLQALKHIIPYLLYIKLAS